MERIDEFSFFASRARSMIPPPLLRLCDGTLAISHLGSGKARKALVKFSENLTFDQLACRASPHRCCSPHRTAPCIPPRSKFRIASAGPKGIGNTCSVTEGEQKSFFFFNKHVIAPCPHRARALQSSSLQERKKCVCIVYYIYIFSCG